MPTYVRDSGVWKPVSGGTTGDNTPVANVPTGAVFHFAASTPPTGYLKANGDTVPNGTGTVQGISANFSTLYAILGSTYGSAGKLPDLRGEFVRGWDDSRGIDSGRVFGAPQLASRINRSSFSSTIADNTEIDFAFTDTRYSQTGPFSQTCTLSQIRPRNIALLACIKY